LRGVGRGRIPGPPAGTPRRLSQPRRRCVGRWGRRDPGAGRHAVSAILEQMHAGAARLADTLASEAAPLGVEVSRLAHGARLIDAGVRATGAIEAGRLYAECCRRGRGRVAVAAARAGRATTPPAPLPGRA